MNSKTNSPSLARWKIVILIVVAVVFMIRIGYIAIRGEIDKEYYTSTEYNLSDARVIPCKNISQTILAPSDRLHSIELCFTDTAEDQLGNAVLGIYHGDSLIYYTDISLEKFKNREWMKVFVNVELERGAEYTVVLNADDDCSRIPGVFVVSEAEEKESEIMASYSDEGRLEGNVAINYGYLRSPSIFDRLVIISFWVILYIGIWQVLIRIESILAWSKKLLAGFVSTFGLPLAILAAEILATLVILGCSGIPFQEKTKVVLFGIAVFSSAVYVKNRYVVNELTDRTWKKVLLAGLFFYAAFSLVGHRLFVYPLDKNVGLEDLFVYLCTVLWFIPVVNTCIILISRLSRCSASGRMKKWKLMLSMVLLLLLPAAYNLIANNPGITSPDTFHTMVVNAQHVHGMVDWHPAFYCMVLRLIENVWNSTYAVIMVQYFFWTYVMVEFHLYIREKGLSDAIILTGAFLSGINACNFMHVNIIWKDIPYSLSVMWTFILTAKLTIDEEKYQNKWYVYLELIVALTGVFFYRRNGFVTCGIIAFALLIALFRNWKVIASLALTGVLIWTVKGPVYSHYQIKDKGVWGMYSGLGQEILGAYYSGGEVSESTNQMICMMTNYNNAEHWYNPTWSAQSYDVDVTPKQFIFNYIDTFLKNPLLVIKAVVARQDVLWDIYAGQDAVVNCVNYKRANDWIDEWREHYPERQYTSIEPRMSQTTDFTENTQWLAAVEWRCGLHFLLWIIAAAVLIMKKGKGRYLAIFSPMFAQVMSLLLSTGWSEFRFFWSINLLSTGMVLMTAALLRHGEKVSPHLIREGLAAEENRIALEKNLLKTDESL